MAGTLINGNVPSYQVLLTQLQTALTNPLTERCLMLSHLLQESPLKELQYVFPAVVENVFGFRSGVDWGLLSLDKNIQCREFDSLRRLLSLDGPLLRLVSKLTEEVAPKFEFPIACLPAPTQMMLQEGKVPPLYANKLQIVNPGFFPSTLQLNAFEFYFFHFAYFIVNSSIKPTTSTVNQQDTLYAHILEDYLYFFLPTDNRAVPLFQAQSNVQHSPILSASLSSNYGNSHASSPDHLNLRSPSRPDFLSPPQQSRPSLLKKGAVMMVASPSSSPAHHGLGSAPAESWRSETFILILREMLLNQNTLDQQKGSLVLIPKTFIASHYHVWMVRIMVKHLHFFFNSSLSSNQASGHGQIMIDSLGRLKSLGMTQLIQKEIYCFLKSTFDHWPLDASFRVPLETYLSYIQPWRYVQTDLEVTVWQKFMGENLLFYTTIFQQILRRFLRMDLSCPKNAYMLFRLTKVICTGELREMIMQAERRSLSKPSSSGMFSYHSPEKFSLHKHSAQFEMTGSSYLPLFSEPVFIQVTHLLSSISAAREKTSIQNPSYGNTSRGFLSKVCSFFEASDDGINSDDNSPSDIRKVDSYLENSSKQLCHFFREVVPPTSIPSTPFGHLNSPVSPSFNNNRTESKNGSTFHELSMSERVQLLHKKRKPEVTYNGNPDLQPVRTYELSFLVHRLNDLSQYLNEKYPNEIEELYSRHTIAGNVCRKLLAEPVTYYDIKKSKDMQSVNWSAVHLPPRVNLRVLAHKQLIVYFFLYLLFSYFLNFNPVLSFLFLMGLVVVGLLASALLYPVPFPDKDD